MLNYLVAIIALFFAMPAMALTAQQCAEQKGMIENTMSSPVCVSGENIGSVEGMACSCMCCVGEKIIDCEKDKVEIYDVCDAGDAMHFRIKYTGHEKIRLVHVDVAPTNEWDGGNSNATSPITQDGIITSKYYLPRAPNMSYTVVAGYMVAFEGSPTNCRYYHKELKTPAIPVTQCTP